MLDSYSKFNFSSNSHGGETTRINILSDNSGYFISSHYYGTDYPCICKYLFSDPSAQCQQIDKLYNYPFGELMINDSQIFMLGYGYSSPHNVYFLKITPGNTAVDWATRMAWDSSSWHVDLSEWLLDKLIFSFIL